MGLNKATQQSTQQRTFHHAVILISPSYRNTLHIIIQRALWDITGKRDGKQVTGCKGKGDVGRQKPRPGPQKHHSPQDHHVEGVVGDAGYQGHKGDEEDGREQEVGTGDGA